MRNYNLQRAPQNIEKRFYNAYREDLDKIGVTQTDISEKGVPDLDKSKPPKGSWSDGYVSETGISFLEEALREYYNKPIQIQEEEPKPKRRRRKKPKQRGAFRASIKSAGAPEEITSLFKAIASLPPKEKEEVGEAITEVIEPVEEKKPKQRKPFRAITRKVGVGEDMFSLFKAASIAVSQSKTEPETPAIEKPEEILKQKVQTALPKLPKELTGARCNYRDVVLYFANDIDRAAYIISSKGRKKDSRRHKEYVEWAEKATGWPVAKIIILGLEIKSHMKELYAQAQQEGDFFINVPDFYSKFKSEFDEVAEEEIETEEESVAEEQPKYDFPGYSYSQFLEKYDKKPDEKKKKRKDTGELTKRQEEILRKILEDLIQIKHRLIEIKKNQDDKIAYEKKRDRLQAERLAFLERERQIEALPETPDSKESTSKKTRESKSDKPTKKGDSWLDSIRNIINTSLISGGASLLLNAGNKENKAAESQSQNITNNKEISGTPGSSGTPGTPGSSGSSGSPGTPGILGLMGLPGNSSSPPSSNLDVKKFAEGGIIGPSGMLPFKDGGEIQSIESGASGNAEIQPLEAALTNKKSSNGGDSTTFSRGFSIENLKSPLAEVMKLPLKVAGSALISAISNLAKQFDITDQKLSSDISKMISDLSRSFGLTTPGFNLSKTDGDNSKDSDSKNDEQSKLTLAINSVADGLVGTGQTSNQSAPPGDNQNTSPGTAPSSSGTTPATPSTPGTTSGVTPATSSSSGTTPATPSTPATPGTASGVTPATPKITTNSKNPKISSTPINNLIASSSTSSIELGNSNITNSFSSLSSPLSQNIQNNLSNNFNKITENKSSSVVPEMAGTNGTNVSTAMDEISSPIKGVPKNAGYDLTSTNQKPTTDTSYEDKGKKIETQNQSLLQPSSIKNNNFIAFNSTNSMVEPSNYLRANYGSYNPIFNSTIASKLSPIEENYYNQSFYRNDLFQPDLTKKSMNQLMLNQVINNNQTYSSKDSKPVVLPAISQPTEPSINKMGGEYVASLSIPPMGSRYFTSTFT